MDVVTDSMPQIYSYMDYCAFTCFALKLKPFCLTVTYECSWVFSFDFIRMSYVLF